MMGNRPCIISSKPMGNRWTLACLIRFFFSFSIILFFVKQLTLLSHASYHATIHYMLLYMNECYHVYHLDCINNYMYMSVDNPNESFN